jgi:hypothetical protein
LKLNGKLRPQGVYIAGNPGTGKSSLIQNLAIADIAANRGVAVIDPTGDLIDRILAHIPEARKNKVIYFDTDDPVPIDFFSYGNPAERQVLTDQLLDIFELDEAPLSRPNLEKILGTLFDANDSAEMKKPENEKDRCTFLDILSFITNKPRRDQILMYAPHRKADWEGDQFKPFDYRSITTRMIPFKENPTLRTMFGAKKPKLNIAEVMLKNRVLLVNLKDTPSDFMVASLIASKFQQATFGRRYIKEHLRKPYYLYIDECHTILKFAAPQFEAILTRARKYKLCLILSNQLPSDLPEPIQRKLGMIYTKILFNLREQDARTFRSEIENATNRARPDPEADAQITRIGSKLNDIEHELAFVKERMKFGDAEDHVSPKKLDRLLFDRRHLYAQLGRLGEQAKSRQTREPLSYLELLRLPKFTALAITGHSVTKIKTPKYLGFSKASYARYIKKRTLENYAGQIPSKRDTDSSAVNIHEEPPQLTKFDKPHPTKK